MKDYLEDLDVDGKYNIKRDLEEVEHGGLDLTVVCQRATTDLAVIRAAQSYMFRTAVLFPFLQRGLSRGLL